MKLRYDFVNGTWKEVEIGDQKLHDVLIPGAPGEPLIVKDANGNFALLANVAHIVSVTVVNYP